MKFLALAFLVLCWGPLDGVSAAPLSEPATPLSEPAAQVLKLAQAGVGDEVLLAYIRGVNAPFALTADNIITLNHDKISSVVLIAMLNHDHPVTAQSTQLSSSAQPASSIPNPDPSAVPGLSIYPVPPILWVHEPWEWGPYFHDHWWHRW